MTRRTDLLNPATIKRAIDRAVHRKPGTGEKLRNRQVFLFGDVIPGGADGEGGHHRLPVCRLRSELLRIQSTMQIVSLPELFLAGGAEKRASLVFTGGYRGQLDYGLPLLEALDLPGHLSIACHQLGKPGHLDVADLMTLKRCQRIGLELEMSSGLPASSRELALLVGNARKMFRHTAGIAPRYLVITEKSLPRHYCFLLSQFGFQGAISANAAGHVTHQVCQLLKAERISSRNWFKIPAF
jgi:hypothetical protein